MLYGVPWPEKITAWLSVELDGEKDHVLVRTIDPGVGTAPRTLRLELLGWRNQRYRPLEAEPFTWKANPGRALPIRNLITLSAVNVHRPKDGSKGQNLRLLPIRASGLCCRNLSPQGWAPETVPLGQLKTRDHDEQDSPADLQLGRAKSRKLGPERRQVARRKGKLAFLSPRAAAGPQRQLSWEQRPGCSSYGGRGRWCS